jgi:hypothetical protein
MKKTIYILLILFIIGCHANVQTRQFERQENNNLKWKILALHIKKHYETNMTVREIAAELAYQEFARQGAY